MNESPGNNLFPGLFDVSGRLKSCTAETWLYYFTYCVGLCKAQLHTMEILLPLLRSPSYFS
ncbi:hypothetical protein HMPREF1141_0106 [Clostridium sp. MSTE9]|nr:hypothetical protein HMPREF1141_0106 [Clostridium sp. MSTE9]